MLSKKDLTSAEMQSVRLQRRPTTLITANGSEDTNEEATVCVKDVDLFVTAQLSEDTPPVLSHGPLGEDRGYFFEWTGGQKLKLEKKNKKKYF